MPHDNGYPTKRPSRKGPAVARKGTKSAASKAFPPNREPKGGKRFGPAPRPPRPSTQNIHNVDKHGKSRLGGRGQ